MTGFPTEAYEHEKPHTVFMSLLSALRALPGEQEEWKLRYGLAEKAQREVQDYNREYDESLMTVHRGGQ